MWLELARRYSQLELPWQAGYAARQALRCDKRLFQALESLAIDSWQNAAAGDGQLGRAVLPEIQNLIDLFTATVKTHHGDWLTWLYLARLYDMLGESAENSRTKALKNARMLEVIPGESLHWLGVWRLNAGDPLGAIQSLSELIRISPVRYGSMMYLGEALLRIGNIQAAEEAFTRASVSNNPDFLLTLAAKVFSLNYWQEAQAILEKVLSIKPDNVPALVQLAKVHWEVYELKKAQDVCQQVLLLDPDNSDAKLLMSALPGRMGDARQHHAQVKKEYEASKDPQSRLASSIAMSSLYNDEMTPVEIAELHRRLCAPIEKLLAHATDFPHKLSDHRKLRIAYVTGDLHRQHPVNIFILPVLQQHDREKFEVCIYHTGNMHDEYTRLAQSCSDQWLEAANLDDAALQQAILADGIDILIDLAGHTSSHRLGVFAMRAAPVQVTFLGYPHSTGLSTMDWIIGDPIVSPAEHAHLFSEGIAQLPNSVFCWSPVDEYPLPQPRPANSPVVFGSFNNVMKLSPKTIALWSKILSALPESLLLLKAPSMRDEAVQSRFAKIFSEHGIDPERLIFRGPSGLADMMQEYGDIDIALDPTPYNGGTTTLQALWMGTPVVTLLGGNFVSRMGASFLATLGKPEWIATDEDSYIATAVSLASKIQKIRTSRPEIRAKISSTPLGNIKTYVADLESLYAKMWHAWKTNQHNKFLSLK